MRLDDLPRYLGLSGDHKSSGACLFPPRWGFSLESKTLILQKLQQYGYLLAELMSGQRFHTRHGKEAE